MSFEAVISLILFLLFVVVPLFGNKKKPDETGKPGTKPQQAPGQQPRTRSVQQQGTAPRQASTSGQGESWEDKLRDARRRIEEAMGETVMEAPRQPAPEVQAPRPPVSRAATSIPGRQTGRGNERTARPPQDQAVQSRMKRERSTAERRRKLREASSTEMQVTRLDSAGPYTGRRRRSGASSLFSPESLQNGLIWHQVLSEPPHRRGRRRTSRLRSP